MADDRTALTGLRDALLSLHKALLAIARDEYERGHEPIAGPGALLQLLVHDEYFGWLRPVSELAARADELLEEPKMPDEELSAIGRAATELLRPDEDGTGFRRRYFDAIQSSADVVIAHARARRAISLLRVSDARGAPPPRP
jgi:hypothetical protein